MAKLVKYTSIKPGAVGFSATGTSGLVAALKKHTMSVNSIGGAANSIGAIGMQMQSIAGATIAFQKIREKNERKLERKQKDAAAENKQEGKLPKNEEGAVNEADKPIETDNIEKKKAKNWFEEMFGPIGKFLGTMAKIVIAKSLMDWIGNPKNTKSVTFFITGIQKVIGWLFKWASGSVNLLLEGFGTVFDSNAPFWERIKGLGKMFLGIIGLSALMNPFGLINSIVVIATNLVEWVKSVVAWWKRKALKGADTVRDATKGADAARDATKAADAVDTARDTAKVADAVDTARDTARAVDAVDTARDTAKITDAAGEITEQAAKKSGWFAKGWSMLQEGSAKAKAAVTDSVTAIIKSVKGGTWLSDAGKLMYKALPADLQKNFDSVVNLSRKLAADAAAQQSKWGAKLSGFGDWVKKGVGAQMDKMGQFATEKVLDPVKKLMEPIVAKLRPMADKVFDAIFDTPFGKKVAGYLKKKGLFPPLDNLGPLSKKLGGKAMPIVGGIVNLGFAYDRFQQKDPLGGLFEALSAAFDLSGLAGFVPGPGISMGIDAYMLARDFIPGILEAEESIVSKIPGAQSISSAMQSIGEKLPPLGDVIKWLIPGGDKEPTEEVDPDQITGADLAEGTTTAAHGGLVRTKGIGLISRQEGGSIGEEQLSEDYAILDGMSDMIPFAITVMKPVAVMLPMPINTPGIVKHAARSPLLDKV